jgi:hypothetical protein
MLVCVFCMPATFGWIHSLPPHGGAIMQTAIGTSRPVRKKIFTRFAQNGAPMKIRSPSSRQ